MEERLKKLQIQVMDWWNKFLPKQKTIIVCVSAGVIFAFILLFAVLTKEQYEILKRCEIPKEASEIKAYLEAEDIIPIISDDGLVVEVLADEISDANMILAANDVYTDTYALDNLFAGGFSTTEADKQKMYKQVLESQLQQNLLVLDYVKSAVVQLSIPEQDGSLLSKDEESHASIILDIEGEMPVDQPYAIAMLVKNALGNTTSNNIYIMDTTGQLLYSGDQGTSAAGITSGNMDIEQRAEMDISQKVRDGLLGTDLFTEAVVIPSLAMNWANEKSVETIYSVADGKNEGYKNTEDVYVSSSTGAVEGGVPGTDANNETTVMYLDGTGGSQEVTDTSTTYLPNSIVKEIIIPPGALIKEECSIAVALTDVNIVKEEDVKNEGLLDGITWEEYKLANDVPVPIEINEEVFEFVAVATGFPLESIKIIANEKVIFLDEEGLSITATDVGVIILVILVVGLLFFVVFSSMRKEKGTEEEDELSVESLLQSTPDPLLDILEVGEKSEKKRVIESFVENNPEAVASLLRNWLNEEWGGGKTSKGSENKISGTQKSAILLIVLGPERSASIFKHLKDDEIEELTLEIANTRSITPQLKETVIDEFYEICLAQQYIAEGGIGYAKELLEKALGDVKAAEVISKLTASLQVKPFEFIRKTDASQLLNFIQDEHPQTIALILSYLAPSQASQIISSLSLDRQPDVTKRIAMMDRTSPDVIKEVERVLESRLASLMNQDYTIIGGVDQVVEILNAVDRGTEKYIMENLEIEEPELADEIRKKMFVFEDILLLDDRAIQRVLRDVDNNDLGLSLKGSTEQVQNAIFNNLSKRLATMIKEDMEFMGPVRMKDVEEAQQKIVNVIRKLEDSAEIVISRGGGDEIIV